MKVTTLSEFADDVWDYRDECDMGSNADSSKRVCFCTQSLQRMPRMKEMLKHYLWSRRTGTPQLLGVGWNSVQAIGRRMRRVCELVEACGKDCFAVLAQEDWLALARAMPKTNASLIILNELALMSTFRNVPFGPIVRMFGNETPRRIMGHVESKQTKYIDEDMLAAMVRRCFVYERHLPTLLDMRRQCDARHWLRFDGSVLGVRRVKDLNVALRMATTAGMMLMLTATGMRASELLSIKRGGLRCDKTSGLLYVHSTVFKFHGTGLKERWLCGDLGRRAYDMLASLGSEQYICCTAVGRRRILTAWLSEFLQEWAAMNGFTEEDGSALHLHAHRFRRTFARQMIRDPEVDLLMLMQQLKHKSVRMTDYYLGSDGDLWMDLMREREALHGESFQHQAMREAGLEGAA